MSASAFAGHRERSEDAPVCLRDLVGGGSGQVGVSWPFARGFGDLCAGLPQVRQWGTDGREDDLRVAPVVVMPLTEIPQGCAPVAVVDIALVASPMVKMR